MEFYIRIPEKRLIFKKIKFNFYSNLFINFFLKFKVQPLKKLDWFNEPVAYGVVGQSLPAFSVTTSAFLTDTLNLISHGIVFKISKFINKNIFLFTF